MPFIISSAELTINAAMAEPGAVNRPSRGNPPYLSANILLIRLWFSARPKNIRHCWSI